MERFGGMSTYRKGLYDGLPVGLGYFSVSFAFGVAAAQIRLPVWAAVAVSMTNLTSAGQLAGLSVIAACGSYLEMALTQLVINLRYALMSVTLSQKMDPKVRPFERMIMAFGNTDELFAIAASQPGTITAPYYYGLMTLPYFCWAGGTFLGAFAGKILPPMVLSALGVAIYGMFVAIVVPKVRRSPAVALVVGVAVGLSCVFAYAPGLRALGGGFAVILSAMTAAAIGAAVRPVEETA